MNPVKDVKKVAVFQNGYTGHIGRAINKRKNEWVDSIFEGVVVKREAKENELLKILVA